MAIFGDVSGCSVGTFSKFGLFLVSNITSTTICWLLVYLYTPLKNMSSSVGMMKFPTEWESHSKFHGSSHHQTVYTCRKPCFFLHGRLDQTTAAPHFSVPLKDTCAHWGKSCTDSLESHCFLSMGNLGDIYPLYSVWLDLSWGYPMYIYIIMG